LTDSRTAAEALRLRALNGRLLLTERDRTADVERWVVSKEFAWLVMRQALEPTAAGLCAGLACATTLARLGQDHLFRTSPLEPFAFGATAVSVASVTLLAATIPALSAARSEPTLALRSE
jgi:hypothetical protein